MKKNTTIRISEKAINYYTTNYKTNHAGCVLACEGYPKLRDEALRNLKSWNLFRDEELAILKSASNIEKTQHISKTWCFFVFCIFGAKIHCYSSKYKFSL